MSGPSRSVGIVQSCYVPWKGHFDLIDAVDHFILFDEAQYTRRDWRNRNQIKTANGPIWLTIPVQTKGRYHQRIDETVVAESTWARRHWQSICQAYARAEHFDRYRQRFEEAYQACAEIERLSDINRVLLELVCGELHIDTPISWSTDYERTTEDPSRRLVELCRGVEGDAYLSGPTARDYLEVEPFDESGIAVRWMDYEGYPEYRQLHPPFVHNVSILDLLFNEGPDAPRFMKGPRSEP